jgi:hypothetical protein
MGATKSRKPSRPLTRPSPTAEMSERREREGEHQLVEDTGWLDLDAAEAPADDFAWRDRELPTIWRVTHALA